MTKSKVARRGRNKRHAQSPNERKNSKALEKRKSDERQLLNKGVGAVQRSMKSLVLGWHAALFLTLPPIFLRVSSSSNFFGVLSSKNSALLARISVLAAWNLNRDGSWASGGRVAQREGGYSVDLNENFVWNGTSDVRYFATSLADCPLHANSSVFRKRISFSLFLAFSLYSSFSLAGRKSSIESRFLLRRFNRKAN